MENTEEFYKLFAENIKQKILKDFENANKVNRDTIKNITISTVYANDTKKYETAIKNNDCDWYIVEYYNNNNDAEINHKKWVEKIKNKQITQILNLDDNTLYELDFM